MAADPLFTAFRAKRFIGGGFDANGVLGDADSRRDVGSHGLDMGFELGTLRNYNGIQRTNDSKRQLSRLSWPTGCS